MEIIELEAKLNLYYKPANVLQKEVVELRILDVYRSKGKALEIMKTALDDPNNIRIKLVVHDKIQLAAKIKELENGLKK